MNKYICSISFQTPWLDYYKRYYQTEYLIETSPPRYLAKTLDMGIPYPYPAMGTSIGLFRLSAGAASPEEYRYASHLKRIV